MGFGNIDLGKIKIKKAPAERPAAGTAGDCDDGLSTTTTTTINDPKPESTQPPRIASSGSLPRIIVGGSIGSSIRSRSVILSRSSSMPNATAATSSPTSSPTTSRNNPNAAIESLLQWCRSVAEKYDGVNGTVVPFLEKASACRQEEESKF